MHTCTRPCSSGARVLYLLMPGQCGMWHTAGHAQQATCNALAAACIPQHTATAHRHGTLSGIAAYTCHSTNDTTHMPQHTATAPAHAQTWTFRAQLVVTSEVKTHSHGMQQCMERPCMLYTMPMRAAWACASVLTHAADGPLALLGPGPWGACTAQHCSAYVLPLPPNLHR